MKVLRSIALCLAAAFLAAGCDVKPELDIVPANCFEFTLDACADWSGAATRTTFANEKTFSWTSGDQISVLFHSGSTDKFFTLTAQGSGASCSFKGYVTNGYSLGAADGSKCALYPASDQHRYEDGTFSFYRPAEIELSDGGFSSKIPMAAITFSSNSFTFRPMCTVAKFTFTGITASRVRLSVKNLDNHTLSGLFPCNVYDPYLVWQQLSNSNADDASRSIAFTETVSDGKAEFYVNCPPWGGSYFKPQITLTDTSTGAVLYSASAKQGLPSRTNNSLGSINVLPAIDVFSGSGSGPGKVSYTESSEIFCNPERGFYKAEEYRSASQSVLSASRLASNRTLGRSLMLLEYYLTEFMSSDISKAYLTLIENNFKALRNGGVKCILRFAYKDNHKEDDHPWDASEEWVMRHIEQLTPLLTSYKDVIFVLQAGFVGSWGEWYYTDNFGMNPSTTADYASRGRVLSALLTALPPERQVQVRTPRFKMKLVGSTALTQSTAHKGTPQSRVGGHNDCFGASSSDSGTYQNSSERSFWAADSRYTIMGGETCKVSDWCHCQASGNAPGTLSELATFHWSYLHDGYHEDVLSRWATEGCIDQIDRELGYRLVLEDASFGAAVAGSDMQFTIHLRNKGYAAPMNPRDVYMVLTDASTGKVLQTTKLDDDPRFWGPDEGQISVSGAFHLPSGISGAVQLHLWMPDPCTTIQSDSRFAVRFANDGVWDSSTGYNLLYSFGL